MIHVATKQLARFERVGHRITGDRRLGSSRGAGYEKAHVAIDDATRLAYVEVLPDEKQATTVGFLLRAVAWFDAQGITCRRFLSDNSSAYRSKPWREACSALGLTPKRTRPYTPRTNGKAERFIKTLLTEWAYSMAFQTQPSETTGYRVIWRSITAAGVTWPWPAAPPFSSSDCCGLLNDLMRKHTQGSCRLHACTTWLLI
jgi:transposase InsO family protein